MTGSRTPDAHPVAFEHLAAGDPVLREQVVEELLAIGAVLGLARVVSARRPQAWTSDPYPGRP